MKMSMRNRLFLEPYKGERKIEASVKSGFATVKQRSSLIGLKLVLPAQVIVSENVVDIFPAGSIVYFEEAVLAGAAWSKHTFNAPELSDKEFIMADYSQAVAINND